MPNYRTPLPKESEKLDRARAMMQRGMAGEKDTMSRLMPTMAKSARDEMRAAKAMRESVPMSAREGEAYNQAGYAKGGSIKKFRYDDGGSVEMEEGSGGYGALSETESEKPKTFKEAFSEARSAGDKTFTFGGKKYTTETAGAKSSAPVSGRPRGESGPTSTTRQMADRSAAEAMNARAASERRAAAARSAEAEGARESRRATPSGTAPKRGVISTAGLNPKTMMPERGFAKGGSIDGCAQRGKTKGKVR